MTRSCGGGTEKGRCYSLTMYSSVLQWWEERVIPQLEDATVEQMEEEDASDDNVAIRNS